MVGRQVWQWRAGERQRVYSAATGCGRGNVAATMHVCAFGGGSVALLLAVLVGVLDVVAVGVSMIYELIIIIIMQ